MLRPPTQTRFAEQTRKGFLCAFVFLPASPNGGFLSCKEACGGSSPLVGSMNTKSTPLITAACESFAGSGACVGSSTEEHATDNRETMGSTPAPRTMGILDHFTAGAFTRAGEADSVVALA